MARSAGPLKANPPAVAQQLLLFPLAIADNLCAANERDRGIVEDGQIRRDRTPPRAPYP